jgi:dTDP-4-amino-4,6-dideoxygalactose transaminase
MLDLPAQHAPIRSEIDDALRRVLESHHFVAGPEVAAFERELAAFCETSFAVACGSGSDALLLALLAVGVGPEDEVICPAYTFFATAGAIARAGARPVFADIDPSTFLLDVGHARDLCRSHPRVRAILPVHLFGRAPDMDSILAIAWELGVPVVQDAAQAIGTRDDAGMPAGSRGTAGCFSFYPSKNLGAFGDGGIVTTNDAEVADRLRRLRQHGSHPDHASRVGFNSRLDAIQAAVLRVKLRHLDEWTKARCENALFYDAAFARGGDLGVAVRTPTPVLPPAVHSYHQYVVRVPAARRDALRAHLAEEGIDARIYYQRGLHQHVAFAREGRAPASLPETEACSREALALPVHPELSASQRERVADRVIAFLRRPDEGPR